MTGRAKKSLVRTRRRSGLKKKRTTRGKRKIRTTKTRTYTSSELLEKVEACLDSFRYEEAVELCVRAVEQEPDSIRVLEEVGPVLLELGHVDRALELLKRAAELSPDDGHLKFLYLGQLHGGEEAAGYLTTAINIMTRKISGKDSDGCYGSEVSKEDISKAYSSLAEIYLTDSCFSSDAEGKCYSYCQQAIQYGPGNAEPHQLLASCLLSLQRTEEAREAIRTSLSLWYVDSGVEGQRSECVGGGERDKEMPSYFSRVNCAKILMELELHDEACSVLERLLRDDDEVVLVWYLMGWLHVLLGDSDSAHFYLEQASKLAEKTDCDDEQMVSHIAELLTDLRQQEEEERGEREKETDTNTEQTNMDTT